MRAASSAIVATLTLGLGTFSCSSGGGWPPKPGELSDEPVVTPYARPPEASQPVELGQLERELASDYADGKLDRFTLLEAALIVSGARDRAELGKLLARARELELIIRAAHEKTGAKTERRRAEVLFEVLHRELFEVYGPSFNDVTATLREGRYNCVSASLVFNAMCERFGIRTAGVDEPSHVYSLVYADGAEIEVETTTDGGFRPFRDEAAYQRFLRERGLTGGYVKAEGGKLVTGHGLIRREPGARSVIPNRGLLAFVYSNSAIGAMEQGDRNRAWQSFHKANRLYPGYARHALGRDAMLHNTALQHIQEGRFEDALRLLRFALAGSATGDVGVRVRGMMAVVYTRLGEAAVARRDLDGLVKVLAEAARNIPKSPVMRNNESAFVQRMAVWLARDRDDLDSAATLFERYLATSPMPQVLLRTWAVLATEKALALANAGDDARGLAVVGDAIRRLGAHGAKRSDIGYLEAVRGGIHFDNERFEEAADALRRSIAAGGPETSRKNLFSALANLALEAASRGDCETAVARAREALTIQRGEQTLERLAARRCR